MWRLIAKKSSNIYTSKQWWAPDGFKTKLSVNNMFKVSRLIFKNLIFRHLYLIYVYTIVLIIYSMDEFLFQIALGRNKKPLKSETKIFRV